MVCRTPWKRITLEDLAVACLTMSDTNPPGHEHQAVPSTARLTQSGKASSQCMRSSLSTPQSFLSVTCQSTLAPVGSLWVLNQPSWTLSILYCPRLYKETRQNMWQNYVCLMVIPIDRQPFMEHENDQHTPGKVSKYSAENKAPSAESDAAQSTQQWPRITPSPLWLFSVPETEVILPSRCPWQIIRHWIYGIVWLIVLGIRPSPCLTVVHRNAWSKCE